MKKLKQLATASVISLSLTPTVAHSHDMYIGQVFTMVTDFCPRGSLKADGSLLQVTEYYNLFALMGTKYGGDGNINFALPRLDNSTLMHCVVVTSNLFPSRT